VQRYAKRRFTKFYVIVASILGAGVKTQDEKKLMKKLE
jgi:hypothetical protein